MSPVERMPREHPDGHLRHLRMAHRRADWRGLRVLAVGDRGFEMCGHLEGAEITVVDVHPPPEVPPGHHFILGDFSASELPDRSFDVVVASDVFEHVPRDRRRAFLAAAARVADQEALVAFPCGPDAAAIESVITRSRTRTAFRSALEDHARLGLPTVEEVRADLDALGVACGIEPLTTVAEWLLSYVVHPDDEDYALVEEYCSVVNSGLPAETGPGAPYRWLVTIDSRLSAQTSTSSVDASEGSDPR